MSISPKKTVGAHACELQQKDDEKINPIDLQEQIHKGNSAEDSFENQIMMAIERGRKDLDGDFYIVVLFKKERLLKNVVRQYFFPRKSCPTPEYDQVVYHYFPNEEKLEFLWVVPDKQSTMDLPTMGTFLPLDQQELVQFARDFNTGELDRLCEKLNRKQ